MSLPIPSAAWDALQDFLRDRKSGQVVFEVRDGAVVACRVQQSIRLEPCAATPMNAGMEFKARMGWIPSSGRDNHT